MQTRLPAEYVATPSGAAADGILRSCVHCGFCNATCPTYQLLGDELDGPRGRIYLIKTLLESPDDAGNCDRAAVHLDRCLTCRACETTCPSGVQYGALLEIARNRMEPRRRSLWQKLQRRWLLSVLPFRNRFRHWAIAGRLVRPFLPAALKSALPEVGKQPPRRQTSGSRRVLLLRGCVQSVVTPDVVQHLTDLLERHEIGALTLNDEPCCGALPQHLGEEAITAQMRQHFLAALKPHLGEVDAIISSASGCGPTVKESLQEFAAQTATPAVLDIAEYLAALNVSFRAARPERRIAWHSPCTLQHGQRVRGVVESLLTQAGYELVPIRDAHLCCGSAGVYSVMQPDIAGELRQNKLAALQAGEPELIATANIGCQSWLGGASGVPVVHWVSLLA